MRRVIEIGGENVIFEMNSLTPKIYKEQFGVDYFADVSSFMDAYNKVFVKNDGQSSPETQEELGLSLMRSLNFDVIDNLAWACAATPFMMAHEIPPDQVEWLIEHPDFNRLTHGMEIIDLVTKNMDAKKN